jgi:hypothetical protein
MRRKEIRVVELSKKARKHSNEKIPVAVAVSNGRKHVQAIPLFVTLITTTLLYKKLAAIEDMPRDLSCSRVYKCLLPTTDSYTL